MSREWPLPSWASKRIFPRHCCSFLFRRCSTFCFHALNCSAWCRVLGTGSLGKSRLCLSGYYFDGQVIRFDAETNLLHPSKAVFLRPPSELTTVVLKLMSALRLTETTIHPTSGIVLETTNLTILNFFLLHFGPMSEKSLVKVLMCSQVTSKPFL